MVSIEPKQPLCLSPFWLWILLFEAFMCVAVMPRLERHMLRLPVVSMLRHPTDACNLSTGVLGSATTLQLPVLMTCSTVVRKLKKSAEHIAQLTRLTRLVLDSSNHHVEMEFPEGFFRKGIAPLSTLQDLE